MTDRPIIELTLHGRGTADIVAAPVAMAGEVAGLATAAARHLGDAAAAVCRVVEDTAFDDSEAVELVVSVRRHAHDVMVAIDDRGMPFNQSGIEAVDARVVRAALERGDIAEFDHFSRGRNGNRSVLISHLPPGPDVREQPPVPAGNEPQPVDEETAAALTMREATGEDAEALARLTWRTYGYSYQHDEYYHPDELRDRLEADDYRGWVAIDRDGDAVGHLAVAVHDEDALVAEGGRGMIDPRYRKHGVMRSLGGSMVTWMHERGLLGLYGHAVTAHTRTQGGEDSTINGVLLGYLPPMVAFKGLAATEVTGRRQAVAMTYTVMGEQPARTAWVPDVDLDIVRAIFERLGLARDVRGVSPLDDVSHEPSNAVDDEGEEVPHLDVLLRRDLGAARLVVNTSTEWLYDVVRDQMRDILATGIDVVYIDLPMSQPATPAVAHELSWLGFYFGGVAPYLAPDGGDVLRYQRTGDITIVPADIKLASTFSARVLEHVLARRDAAGTT